MVLSSFTYINILFFLPARSVAIKRRDRSHASSRVISSRLDSYIVPSTSTKKVNVAVFFKQMTNGTCTNAFKDKDPLI